MNIITNASILLKIRIAGILFLLSLIIPILNWGFILSDFNTLEGDTASWILENEFLYRFNILNQIITGLCILTLGWLLYLILKPVHRTISFFAFILKGFESFLFLVLSMVYFLQLLFVKSGFNQENILNSLLNNYINLTAIPGIFLGFSMLIFSILLLNSGIISKWLAILGICSYALVVLYDSLIILSPAYSSKIFIQIIGSAPVCIFQILISLCFILKKNK
jgi:hypothetical protein